MARKHNDKLKEPPWLRIDENRPLRHAFEVRHESFLCDEFMQLLRKHNAALMFADSAAKLCYAEDVTSDFIYIRLHGSTEIYTSGYSDEELGRWAEKIRKWRTGGQPVDASCVTRSVGRRSTRRDVYAFFDNDAKIHAPFDAQRLAAMLRH